VSDYAVGLGASSIENVHQLAFDESGNLYVGVENRIFKLPPGGSPATVVVSNLTYAMGFVRWTGDNFIVRTYTARSSCTRRRRAATGRRDHLGPAAQPLHQRADAGRGQRRGADVHGRSTTGFVYIADGGCNAVRMFAIGDVVPVTKRNWGAVKLMYR